MDSKTYKYLILSLIVFGHYTEGFSQAVDIEKNRGAKVGDEMMNLDQSRTSIKDTGQDQRSYPSDLGKMNEMDLRESKSAPRTSGDGTNDMNPNKTSRDQDYRSGAQREADEMNAAFKQNSGDFQPQDLDDPLAPLSDTPDMDFSQKRMGDDGLENEVMPPLGEKEDQNSNLNTDFPNDEIMDLDPDQIDQTQLRTQEEDSAISDLLTKDPRDERDLAEMDWNNDITFDENPAIEVDAQSLRKTSMGKPEQKPKDLDVKKESIDNPSSGRSSSSTSPLDEQKDDFDKPGKDDGF